MIQPRGFFSLNYNDFLFMIEASPIIKEKELYFFLKKEQIIKTHCAGITWRESDSKNKVPI